MDITGFLLLSWLCGVVNGYTPFRLTDCTNSSNKIASAGSNLHLLDYPITIPGNVRVSADVHVHRNVTDNLRLDVTVERFLLFTWLRIPCINRIGSCSYDFCGLLDWFTARGCPWQLRASNSFPCVCPFEIGTYTLRPHPFHIPSVHGAWQWVAFGDFRVTGRLRDTMTGEEVGCYSVEFTTQQPRSSSPFSWFWDG